MVLSPKAARSSGSCRERYCAGRTAPGLTRLHMVTSMHRRKAQMSSLSDGFLTLPGGFGTLEEFFETLTWAQLRLHTKPCALLNVAGFWDDLLAMADTMVNSGFVPEVHRELILSDKDPEHFSIAWLSTFHRSIRVTDCHPSRWRTPAAPRYTACVGCRRQPICYAVEAAAGNSAPVAG